MTHILVINGDNENIHDINEDVVRSHLLSDQDLNSDQDGQADESAMSE